MSVDKKSDYVGNHGGAYTDINGMRRQFTVIDHDIKPNMATFVPTDDEIQRVKKELADYRENVIRDILALPAAALPVSHNFTFGVFRFQDGNVFHWDEDALRDPSIEIELLTAVRRFTKNRMEGKIANIL